MHDVLLFCNGDFVSTYLMLQGLMLFSASSGLWPNKDKTEIYYNNVKDADIQRLSDASGFKRSTLPFRYLGFPINSKRISAADCSLLVEKMTARIRTWSSRHLSFAGRIILVNYVLLTIHIYWSQLCILPKHIIQEIIAVCRAYLWSGKINSDYPGNIAWGNLCKPKSKGGLGFQNSFLWNQAAIGKHVWAIAVNKENLWVRWIHHVYMKDNNWWEYKAPQNCSWYWKKVVEIKDHVKGKMTIQQFTGQDYRIKKFAQLFDEDYDNLQWTRVVWDSANMPKHQFISWLAMHDRLKTKERLKKMGITPDDICLLCGDQSENQNHLFFECAYSNRCWLKTKEWMQWHIEATGITSIVRWIGRKRTSKFRKKTYAIAFTATIYHIWKTRNEVLWQGKLKIPNLNVQEIKNDVINRIVLLKNDKLSPNDNRWYRNIICR